MNPCHVAFAFVVCCVQACRSQCHLYRIDTQEETSTFVKERKIKDPDKCLETAMTYFYSSSPPPENDAVGEPTEHPYSVLWAAVHEPEFEVDVFPPFGCISIVCKDDRASHCQFSLSYHEDAAWNETTCLHHREVCREVTVPKATRRRPHRETQVQVHLLYGMSGARATATCARVLQPGGEGTARAGEATAAAAPAARRTALALAPRGATNNARRRAATRASLEAHALVLNDLGLALARCAPPLPRGFLCAGRELRLAAAAFGTWVQLDPRAHVPHYNLGAMQFATSQAAEGALAHMLAAAYLAPPDNLVPYRGVARLLVLEGRHELGELLLRPHLARCPGPGCPLDMLGDFAELAPALGRTREAIALLEGVLAAAAAAGAELAPPDAPDPVPALHFGLGRLYDKLGEYGTAFDHFLVANRRRRENTLGSLRLKPPPGGGQPSQEMVAGAVEDFLFGNMQHVANSITAEVVAGLPSFDALARELWEQDVALGVNATAAPDTVRGLLGGALPAFIVGMPRSGSSLLEQVLEMHPNISGSSEDCSFTAGFPSLLGGPGGGAGMMGAVPKRGVAWGVRQFLACLRERVDEGSVWVTSKLPGHLQVLGYIHALLPAAPLLVTERHPLDALLSNFQQNFATNHHTCSLADLAHYWRLHLGVLAHWQGLGLPLRPVHYERVVADLRGEVSRLLAEAFGLPWHAACARFAESRKPCYTASNLQVRRPLYAGAVGRWRRYAALGAPEFEAFRREMNATFAAMLEAGSEEYLRDLGVLVDGQLEA